MFSISSILTLFIQIAVFSMGTLAFLQWVRRIKNGYRDSFVAVLAAIIFFLIAMNGVTGFFAIIEFALKSTESAAIPWKYSLSLQPLIMSVLALSILHYFSSKNKRWFALPIALVLGFSAVIFAMAPISLNNHNGILMPDWLGWQTLLILLEGVGFNVIAFIYVYYQRMRKRAKKEPFGHISFLLKACASLSASSLVLIIYALAHYSYSFLFILSWIFVLSFIVHFYLCTIVIDDDDTALRNNPALYFTRSLALKIAIALNVVVWITVIGAIMMMTTLINSTVESYLGSEFINELVRQALIAQGWFLLLSVLILVITTFFIIYFIKSLLRPIAQLKEGTKILGQGNLHYRIENRSDDELGMLAENFNEMAVSLEKKHKEIVRLKELDKIKSQFVSTASHQLRTPLTAIRWIVSMLLKRKADGKIDSANDTSLLHTLYDSNLRMINLVNNLLDASKLETRSMKIVRKPVSLVELIEKQITELINQIIEKDIHVRLCLERESVGIVMGDKEMLYMAVQNLISNAINYNKQGGYVRITLSNQGKNVLLTIADSGIGIQQEDSKNLFTKFYRGREATTLKTNGSGLGLFITKSIITNHRGRIWFTSKPDMGTSFHIKFPKSEKARKK